MKYKIFIITVFILTNFANSQWVFDSRVPNYTYDWDIRYYVVDSSIIWDVTLDQNNQLYTLKRSVSGWSRIQSGGFSPTSEFTLITAVDSLRAFFGTTDGRIYYTSNGGNNWFKQIDLRPYSYIDGIAFSKKYPNIGYAFADTTSNGNYCGVIVFKTTNGGINWSSRSFNVPGYVGEGTAISVVDSDCVWFGLSSNTGANGKILSTSNNGANWSIGTAYGGNDGPNWIQFSDDKVTGVYMISSGIQNGHIIRTTNSGNLWSSVFDFNNSVLYPWSIIVWVPGTSNVYAQNWQDRIYRSTDNGINWNVISSDSNLILLGVQKINSSSIYLWGLQMNDTNEFSYKKIDTLHVFGIQNISSTIPKSFQLYQNYPNPFNPETKINFQIAKSGFVTLKIYDVLGREVSVLINGNIKPGTYSVDWDASNYSSGVYFYRMETESFVEIKKMVVIK